MLDAKAHSLAGGKPFVTDEVRAMLKEEYAHALLAQPFLQVE